LLEEEEDVVERPRSPTPHPQLHLVAAGLESTVAEVDSVVVKRDLMVVKLNSMPVMVDLVAGELKSVGEIESIAMEQACCAKTRARGPLSLPPASLLSPPSIPLLR
jgi:hypothetical protein